MKINATRQFKIYPLGACALLLVFGAAIFAQAQSSTNVTSLREHLRAHYDIVALQDSVGLVPHQNNDNIRLIEIHNGAIAINGAPLTAQEARERLGKDADMIFAVTYLDSAAQRELARPDSAATAPSSPDNAQSLGGNGSESESLSPNRAEPGHNDFVRIGTSMRLPKGERVDGDVVSIGGSADVDGEVARDVSVIGGSLNLGPDAIVHGDVAVVGGSMTRSPGARVDGKVAEVGIGLGGAFPWNLPSRRNFRARQISPAAGLAGTILRTTLMLMGGLLVVTLGGRFVGEVAERAAHEPLRSGLAGLVAEICFVPLLVVTVLVLAVSIIGIPLLILVPFAVAFAVVLMFIGFTGIAAHVGRLMSTRFGNQWGPYLSVAVGVLTIVAITLIARITSVALGFSSGLFVSGPLRVIGFLVEYVAWTMGIGAVILAWRSRRHPAPTPSPAPGPTGGSPVTGIIVPPPIAGAPAGQ